MCLPTELKGNIVHIFAFDMFRKVSKAKESFPKAFAATNRQQLPKLSAVSARGRNSRTLIGGYIIIYSCAARQISFHIEQFDLKRKLFGKT